MAFVRNLLLVVALVFGLGAPTFGMVSLVFATNDVVTHWVNGLNTVVFVALAAYVLAHLSAYITLTPRLLGDRLSSAFLGLALGVSALPLVFLCGAAFGRVMPPSDFAGFVEVGCAGYGLLFGVSVTFSAVGFLTIRGTLAAFEKVSDLLELASDAAQRALHRNHVNAERVLYLD